MELEYDPTINLGTIIAILVFLAGMLKLSGRIAVIEFKVNQLWNKSYGKMGQAEAQD